MYGFVITILIAGGFILLAEITKKTIDCCRNNDPISDNIPNHINIDCSICQNSIGHNQHSIKTPCRHTFHSNCIIRWTIENSSCPICRKPIQITARISNENTDVISIV